MGLSQWLNTNTIQAGAAVTSVFVAGIAVWVAKETAKWARQQAEAAATSAQQAEQTLLEMQRSRHASLRPLVIPLSGPWFAEWDENKHLSVHNHGPGPAVDLLVRLWQPGARQIGESDVGLLLVNASTLALHANRELPARFLPLDEHVVWFEAIYRDMFGSQHRTTACWQNGMWADIQVDRGGSRNPGELLIGTRYLAERKGQ